jgi:hypothetical protein
LIIDYRGGSLEFLALSCEAHGEQNRDEGMPTL